jgi:ankyrin repeat protein
VVVASLAVLAGLPLRAEDDGTRRLLVAASSRDAAEVAALLRSGVSADAADRSGWTGLHEAASRGDVATARVLLEAGARPDLRSRARGTPLDLAERSGYAELARLLRAHGARGSGKSLGDTVCVRPWGGDGYCGTVEALDPTTAEVRITRVVGCSAGCPPEPVCSRGRAVGPGGLGTGGLVRVPFSCLTHTGVR